MNFLSNELDKMGFIPQKIEEIRKKDGIFLYRVYRNNHSYVLKYFDIPDGAREILYYDLLQQNGVPTLEIYEQTDRAILMEDMLISPRWRLGESADLEDPQIASSLAEWYQTLHGASKSILKGKTDWYSEYGLLTPENLQLAADKTGTTAMGFWTYLDEHLPELFRIIENLEPVINYNDFYYTNLAVSRNGQKALMFDYNCMGKGYRAADLRNVSYSLGKNAAQVFLEHYGSIPEEEYQADDVISALTTLIMASKRPEMPSWSTEAVQTLKSGKLAADFRDLISG